MEGLFFRLGMASVLLGGGGLKKNCKMGGVPPLGAPPPPPPPTPTPHYGKPWYIYRYIYTHTHTHTHTHTTSPFVILFEVRSYLICISYNENFRHRSGGGGGVQGSLEICHVFVWSIVYFCGCGRGLQNWSFFVDVINEWPPLSLSSLPHFHVKSADYI